jgi:hypothetical protein
MDQDVVSTFDLTQRLSATREELIWFFTSSDAAMGLHGAGLEPGSVVFDEKRSWELHLRKHAAFHRHQVAKRARVVDLLFGLSAEHRIDLARVYVPFGTGRADPRTIARLTKQKRPLLGLLLHTQAIRRAFAKDYGDEVDPPADVLLRYVDDELEGTANEPLKSNHKFRRALDEADERETTAAQAYDAARPESLRAEQRREREDLEAELDRIDRKTGT